ncbi:MAG: DegT/DnrJ/EryC1/StrS family aminotransferase [Planctomycetota bacterium]|jgi:perosamine synthetase
MSERRISLAYVKVTDQARRNVLDCLDTGMLARGIYVGLFEEMIAEFAGTNHAVAVCNGTFADTIVLRAAREVHGWCEVTVPALTFAAQLSATLDAGFSPYFVDLTPGLRMLFSREDGARPRNWFATALLGVHAELSGSQVILDSCETFARGFGENVLAATCSFYATHAVGIGEGGAVVTDDEDMARVCRSLRDHGQREGDVLARFKHERRGYNGKMSNLAAAVGCGQIVEADQINAKRLQVAGWYDARLAGEWASKMASPHGYPVEAASKSLRNVLLLALTDAGVDARRLFSVLPFDENAFKNLGRLCEHGLEPEDYEPFPVARRIADRYLYVPCHQGLTPDDVNYVSDALLSVNKV